MDPAAYEVVHDLEESHWFFVARRRILSRLLDEMLEGAGNPRILDVGCGTGATMGFLERYGEVIGVDIAPQALKYGREQGRARLCLADGGHLPFLEDSFDLVTALDLLEHLEHEEVGLREMWRVLKNGGRLLAVVPAFAFLWSDFDRFSGHYRRYSKQELRSKIEGSGFQVSRLSYFNTLLFPFVWGVRTFKNWAGTWRTFRSDLEMRTPGLNSLLASVFSMEGGLMARGDLPFGVSLICIARKRP
ncbi:MAG TPA: methyltransferase domain-containing protein, partial [Anaerolineae bacterium]|nr:methyltransferase domain-containing protein [Anaerolineae bacterium]